MEAIRGAYSRIRCRLNRRGWPLLVILSHFDVLFLYDMVEIDSAKRPGILMDYLITDSFVYHLGVFHYTYLESHR